MAYNVCSTPSHVQVEGYNGGAVNIVDWDFIVDEGKDEVTNTQKPMDGFKLGQLILVHGKFQARLVAICDLASKSHVV